MQQWPCSSSVHTRPVCSGPALQYGGSIQVSTEWHLFTSLAPTLVALSTSLFLPGLPLQEANPVYLRAGYNHTSVFIGLSVANSNTWSCPQALALSSSEEGVLAQSGHLYTAFMTLPQLGPWPLGSACFIEKNLLPPPVPG